MNNHVDILILGAGIAGLGASLKAQQCGREAIIFEAEASAGGLLDNFTIDGFRFDKAVHLSFATESEVRTIFDKTPYITHKPEVYNFDNGKWLKHPAQNNLFPLETTEKIDLIKGVIDRPEKLTSDNYEDWLRYQYGNQIAERYPLKYTRKYWQTEAAELSTSWIGNRMRQANIDEILFGAFSNETPNDYYVKEMRYPKFGGYKAFIEPLIKNANIQLNHKACAINLNNHSVTFTNGKTVNYNQLVSTLPLPLIIELCEPVGREYHDAASKLAATSIDLISIGFNKNIIDQLWFYIYDEDILASRAHSPSVKSPNNVPAGCSSIQFEIYNRSRVSQYDEEFLKQNTLYALKKMKLCKDEDINFIHHKFLPWGNVIFLKDMETHRQKIRNFLYNQGIITCGRFGEWDYLWSNQAFLSGLNIRL